MERMTMTVQELAEQMGISKPKAYEICKREDFDAVVMVGKRVVIVRKLFEDWLVRTATNGCKVNGVI